MFPPSQRPQGFGSALAGWILLAAVVHALGWLSWMALRQRQLPTTPHKEVVRLSQAADPRRRQALKMAQQQLADALKRPPPAKKEALPRGQVVELAPSASPEAPTEAAYLAEHHSKVERQTRSRHASADFKRVAPEVTAAAPGVAATADMPVAPRKAPRRSGSAGRRRQPGQAAAPARDWLALKLDPDLGRLRPTVLQPQRPAAEAPSRPVSPAGASPEAPQDAPGDLTPAAPQGAPGAATPGPAPKLGMADLVPSVGVLARLAAGPRPDALEGVDVGEGTFLNAKEFKYASFFNRLHRSVSEHWRPMAAYAQRDPTGQVFGVGLRVTTVRVSLDRQGDLQEVAVKQSSGLTFLDEEAVGAFRRAAPFPNPPAALADDAGRITFLFGFHVDVQGGSLGRY